MKMPKIIMMIAFAGVLLSCNNMYIVQGSGRLLTQDFSSIAEFSSIDINDQSKVNITYGNSCSVSIIADDNLYPYISVMVVNGTLVIDMRDDKSYSDFTFTVDVELPVLYKVDIDGVSYCHLENFDISNDLQIYVDGVSSVDALNCSVNGNLNLAVNGTSSARLSALPVSGNCLVSIDGVSMARINTAGIIYGGLSGVSSLAFTGGTLNPLFDTGGITCSVTTY